jgi:hypothetical protein
LKEEILIETPTKFEAPVTMFDYEIQGVRKAAVAPASPIQCVSFQVSNAWKFMSIITQFLGAFDDS